MPVDVAHLRGLVEVRGAEQAQQQLAGVGRAFDEAGRRGGQAATGMTALGTTLQTTGARARDAQGRFVAMGQGAQQAGQSVGRVGQVVGQAGALFGAADQKVEGFKSGIQQLSPVALGTTGAVVGLGLAAKSSIDASIAWESALAGIAKTLDTTGLSAAQADQAVADMGAEIRAMSLEIPIAAVELAGVAEAAGQLGVAREDVVEFTETMAKLGVATDLTAEESAVAIARIANITQLATDDIDNFGAALVDLGNNSAATESEILAMATRIAAAGNMAGLTEGEILGLSAALTSVGINAEAGGTAISQVMAEITKSVEMADDRLALFAEVAGMSAAQFAEVWRNEPAQAIAAFVEGLAAIEDSGGSSVLVLKDLQLAGIRQSQALRSAAGAGDLMRDSMDRGNRAMEEGIALNIEAAQRFETTASQIQLFKNNVEELKVALGDLAIPQLTQSMDDLLPILQGITSIVQDGAASEQQWNDFLGGPDWFRGSALAALDFFGVVKENETTLPDSLRTVPAMLDVIEEKLTGPALDAVREFFGAPAEHQSDATFFNDLLVATQRILGIMPELAVEQAAYTDELDRLRNMGQQAAIGMREATASSEGWGQALAAIFDAVGEQPEAITGFMDEIVNGFRAGQVELGQIGDLISMIPEDVFHDAFIPALKDLRVEWLTTIAEMGDPTEIAVAQENLAALDTILQGLGITLENVKVGIGTFGDVQDIFQQNIDLAAGKIGEWEGHLSGAERALKILQDRQAAGEELTPEQLAQLDTLTWATERYSGGVKDNEQALIDAEVAMADFIRVQDEVNQGLADKNLTQEEANALLDEARAKLDPATRMTLDNADAQRELAEGLDATVDKMALLLYHAGLISETEAEAIIGADITEGEANLDRMEGRLQTYEGSTYTADLDLSTVNAINAYNGFLSYLAANPATIDLYVNQNNAIGFTTRASGGPLDAGQLALVGEEGPELIVTNAPAHVIPNDETMRLLALANGFAGGFAEGTGGQTAGVGQRGVAVDGSGFQSLGAAIAEAIALGVKLGLIESGEPTGAEYAKAIIDGATEDLERIPELAANLGQDTVMGLLQEYSDLQGQLQLAILSGEDTADIQAQLDAIFAIFAAWSGNTVDNVEAVWDAITDEQRAAAAQAMWDDVLGAIQTPSAPVSISIEDIISGDAIADVRETFFELYDLQKMYEEAGLPEQAAAIGEQMKALGLQEELIESLAGTDTAQKLAEELRLEELGAALDERMDAVLGDDPLGIADSIQDEIDDLQTKIDLGPAMGVPQEIIDGWAAERDALTGEQDQFWSDLATAFSAGALDPEVLAELDEAGRAQLGNYIMGLFGQGAYEDFVAAMEDADYAKALEEGVVKATDESLSQLAALFEETPELAVDMIDDLLGAVNQGQMSFEDAMALLAGVPEKDLIPALEGLEETLTADLAQALLSYGPDSPQVQAILASLGLIDTALDDVAGAAEDATTALDNLPGAKDYVAPGDQTPDAAPGTANTGTAALSAVGVPGMDFSDLVAGVHYTIPGDGGWAEALAGGAVISIDADGLMYPESGYEMWKSGQNVYVNPFADGGIVTAPTLALIGEAGTEGVFPLDRASEFGFGGGISDDDARKIARALAEELRRAPIQNQVYMDGRDISHRALQHLSTWTPAGARSAP